MLATPLSKLNISCSCTECNTFLRPLSKSPASVHIPSSLLPSTLGLGFSLPPTPAATPIPTRKCTPSATPHILPTAPTLAPSPAFLLTRTNSQKSRKEGGGPLALPSVSLSPMASKRVDFASRSLWANISGLIDECVTPLSAKTPGLATCAQEQCGGKVVPRFGLSVCESCEDELRGAVLGLAAVMEDDSIEARRRTRLSRATLSRADSGIVLSASSCPSSSSSTSLVRDHPAPDRPATHRASPDAEPSLFAVPSTSPSTRILIAHSRNHSLATPPHQRVAEGAHALFALPSTSLDKSFEEFTPTTPTTKYAQDFIALPLNSSAGECKTTSVKASKRSSRDVEGLARSLSKNGRKKESTTGSHVESRRNSKPR